MQNRSISEQLPNKTKDDRPVSRSSNSSNSSNSKTRNTAELKSATTRSQEMKHVPSLPGSNQSTPKRVLEKRERFDDIEPLSPTPSDINLFISGTPAPRLTDRANSLPTTRKPYRASPSNPARKTNPSMQSPETCKETSLDEELSIDLSAVSGFKSMKSFGVLKHSQSASTYRKPADRTEKSHSTPFRSASGRLPTQKSRRNSGQWSYSARQNSLPQMRNDASRPFIALQESSHSRTSLNITRRSSYSSFMSKNLDSPEYTSGQSSNDDSLSPASVNMRDTAMVGSESTYSTILSDAAIVSPFSQKSELTDRTLPNSGSSHYTSLYEMSGQENIQKHPQESQINIHQLHEENGEWNNFWTNYNNSFSCVPIKPTQKSPGTYTLASKRTDLNSKEPTDLDTKLIQFSDVAMKQLTEDLSKNHIFKRTVDLEAIDNLKTALKDDNLSLTAKETSEIMNCVQVLTEVLANAIGRHVKCQTNPKITENMDVRTKKAKENLTLDIIPALDVEELKMNVGKMCVDTKTQTDISLPNTQYAPRIFDRILRELSRSSRNNSEELEEPNVNPND